ncbi:MAG: hypothetical protein M5U28_37465 [Sandaracinaceae bacterium]|nr:hypothetical protein [Sandaracinaceae bacterium]
MEITLVGFLILLALALVVGLVAKAIMGFHRGGLLAAIGLGFIGGLIGVVIANATGLPELLAVDVGGTRFPIIWALIGTVILIAIVSLFTGGTRFTRRKAV